MPLSVIAERLSARHLILLHSRITFVCMYVCMYVCMSHFNYCVGDERFRGCGLHFIYYCTGSLQAEVHVLAIYAKYVAPPTKSMSA